MSAHKRTVVLVCGMDGVGKSFYASQLAVRLGNAHLMAFATALREMVAKDPFLPYSQAQLYEKPTPPAIRQVLRAQSTRYKEVLGKTVFADYLVNALEADPSSGTPVIIHDARYKVEYDALRDWRLVDSENRRLITVFMGRVPTEREVEEGGSSFADLAELQAVADWHLPFRCGDADSLASILNDGVEEILHQTP